MRIRAFTVLFAIAAALPARAQDREISLDRGIELQALGVRISGFFVGSYNYNSRIQLVPEFAGSAPVSSEPGHTDFRFDQFSIGAFKTFSPWLSAGASIEVERTGARHSHGFDPDFGCPGTDTCIEQFGTEAIETEVSLHRFNITAVAPLGNGLALSLGRFDVPFGYERHDAALNLTATTSELQRFGRPQSMTGFQVAYSFTPWLDAVGWFVNRWENETTEDPPEDNNAAKSVGGRIGITPIRGEQLLALGVGGFWGPEQDDNNSNARWIVDADATLSLTSQLLFAGEFLYGGESGVSFRRRGLPFPADAVDSADVHWLALYALAHYDVLPWLGASFRYGFFKDFDGARTGVAQSLHSFTIVPIVHLSRLIPELRPLGVAYARTRHPVDWVDLRLEYRLAVSDQAVFSDAPPGEPITQAGKTAHVVTAQVVVNY
ncbi:MAG TPA: outer membrane beta-barrel protein [Myxococcales bacterium]|nr:outer membrane beta-barrel protein [Myxococcales bacterium]